MCELCTSPMCIEWSKQGELSLAIPTMIASEVIDADGSGTLHIAELAGDRMEFSVTCRFTW